MDMEAEKKKGKYEGYDDYEVDSAVDTLMKAEEIKRDPKLMKHCNSCMGEKSKSIKSIADLKQAYDEHEEDEGEM